MLKVINRAALVISAIFLGLHFILWIAGKPVPAQSWMQVLMNDGAWVVLFAYFIAEERKKS